MLQNYWHYEYHAPQLETIFSYIFLHTHCTVHFLPNICISW